jgi:hypothetical protein
MRNILKNVSILLFTIMLLGIALVDGYSAEKNPEGSGRNKQVQYLIEQLYQQLEHSQWKGQDPYFYPIHKFLIRYQPAGLFPSQISFGHFFREIVKNQPGLYSLGKVFVLGDDNMFTTALIVQVLLEAESLGGISIDSEMLFSATWAMLEHKDKNLPVNLPAFGFYKQRFSDGHWEQTPLNIKGLMNRLAWQMYGIHRLLRLGGLDISESKWFQSPGINKLISEGSPDEMLQRFQMPADIDDTGLAIGFGIMLAESAALHPDAVELWREYNFDYSQLFAHMTHFTYRPFSSDTSRNLIDPRTYHWMRSYLATVDNPKVDFLTTWMQNVYEHPHLGNSVTYVPLNMNNVEPTVCANFLFGWHKFVLSVLGEDALFSDSTFWESYRQTADLLCWLVNNNLIETYVDIMFLYYPTVYQFYWSMARNLHLLENAARQAAISQVAVDQVRREWGEALRAAGTRQLLAMKEDTLGICYWQTDIKHVDDRIFCTALVVNCLMDIWTVAVDGDAPTLCWIGSTPLEVRQAVERGVCFLLESATQRKHSLENLCFSGSVKGYKTLPFLFPMNSTDKYQGVEIYGVRGLIPEESYQRQFQAHEARFPEGGLGKKSQYFTYWTSPAFTRAVTILALTKYQNLAK